MVRKKRTDGPSEGGEGSGSRDAAPASGGGRGGYQQGRGGGGGGQQQGGRGYSPQSQQGGRGGGRGYGQPQQQQFGDPREGHPPQQQQQQQYGGPRGGQPPQQQQYGGPRGGQPPQQQQYSGPRGGQPPSQQQYGGPRESQPPQQQHQQYGGPRGGPPRGGGRGGASSAGLPQRQSVPELHQATLPTYQAVSSQPTPAEVSPTQMPDPPAPVQEFEQLSIEQGAPSQAIQPIPSSSKACKFPLRPGKGQFGKRCIVKANHFFAELPDKDLHQYDVTITPEVTSRGVNRAVMKQLVDLYRETHLGRRLPAYDGRKSLYTAGPLPFVSKEFRILLQDEEEGAGGQRREREFKVVIKLAARDTNLVLPEIFEIAKMLRRLLTQTSSPRRLLSSKTPFFSKPSLSPFSSLPSSPDPPSSASSHVEESGSAAAAGTTISVDRSALFNPPDHSHEPTPDSELVKHLKSVIKFRGGPISVAEYMEEVLTNPRSGYYMNRDVFGAQGDFITSPEVSQMFGEMIGVWTVCLWEQMGKPERVNLIELGPGRGTLMVDLLRGTSKFRNFTESLHIHLVECSPALQKIQHQNLKCTDESSSEKKAISSLAGTPVHWHATLEEVPSGVPTIIIAHEFYDALPVHQFQKTPRGWCEKMVDVGEDSQFRFVLSPQPTPAALYLVKRCTWATPEEKEKLEHVEISPKSMDLTQEIAKRVGSDGGGALIIDYGKDVIISDSLQAIREHKFVNILDDPGSADLSAYVDFPSIKHSAEEASENVTVHGPMTQSQFLGSLGINFRVDALLQNCDDEQAESLRSGYWRLVGDGEAPFWEGPDEQTPIGMGERYLAMAIVNRNQGTPAPFQ